METKRFPGTVWLQFRVLCTALLFFLHIAGNAHAGAPMQNYCAVPPFASAGVGANLLLLIDNSASMYDLAYTDTDPAKSASQKYCLDTSYDNTRTYAGYFDPATAYLYDGTTFNPGAFPPSCVDGSASYLCLNLAGSSPSRYVQDFAASGNFLNWLSMSRLDVEKAVLTGGKTVSDTVLQGETRGCQGKRFVKTNSAAPGITFAVRGPIVNSGVDYTTLPGPPGATVIEVYDKAYTSCSAAVEDWGKLVADPANFDLNTLKNDAIACRGKRYDSADQSVPSKNWVYTEIMTDCYAKSAGKALSADASLLTDCQSRIEKAYLSNTKKPVGLDAICSSSLTHSPRYHADGTTLDTSGFLASNNCFIKGKGFVCTETQELDEMLDYCQDNVSGRVTDPSKTAGVAGKDTDVPGYILDGAVANLGNVAKYSAAGKAIQVRVSVSSKPTGLIQQFGSTINFGAMVFNDNGAWAECQAGSLSCKHCVSGGTDTGLECSLDAQCAPGGSCQSISASDGGRIISYINDPSVTPGDTSALVSAVNGIVARSWTPFAESFYNAIGYFSGRTKLRLQPADFDEGKPPSQYPCQSNNVLIISDGMSSADSRTEVSDLASLYASASGGSTGYACPAFSGSSSLDDLAWIAAHRNIKTFSMITAPSTDTPVTRAQSITTHVVFTGTPNSGAGECDAETLMKKTAASGGGLYAAVTDLAALRAALNAVLQQVADGSGSGDASIFATGNASGALYLKEQYFRKKSFDGGATSASWIGDLFSLWYYIDPFLGGSNGAGSSIREDTVSDKLLSLTDDSIVSFRYDEGSEESYAYRAPDANGDGSADSAPTQVDPDALKSLWRAGTLLWQRGADDRTIYTQTSGTSLTSFAAATFPLSDSDGAANQKLLQAANASEGGQILSWVRGSDSSGYRTRTLSRDGVSKVWKLGDIISSGVKVQSPVPLNAYHLPSPVGYDDASYRSFIRSSDYQQRATAYVGANDGMLHAFNLGLLDTTASGPVKGKLCASGSPAEQSQCLADLGKEQWAFIPRNVLPYLKYLADPAYQHLYSVDGGITLVDASIGNTTGGGCDTDSYWRCVKGAKVQDGAGRLDPAKNTWRTVLIGGMGLGGASADSCAGKTDCVETPIADPAAAGKRLGYSSYFALDVTDPKNPSLLWEFTNPALGYSTSGPAIVRIGAPDKNGRWFAVFGSGPTGPIDTVTHQFLGRSNQTLKFFVVDLRSGALITTIDTTIDKAFSGSLSGGAADLDRWNRATPARYQDDVIYAGYTADDGTNADGSRKWKGGVGRLVVYPCRERQDDPSCRALDGSAWDPEQDDLVQNIWQWSPVLETPGPVTAGIAKLQDRTSHKLWLYFGTGRYFYRTATKEVDDRDTPPLRSLYGITDPCYSHPLPDVLEKSCRDSFSGSITNQSSIISAAVSAGWRIDLAASSGDSGAERVISDPAALTSGAVLFPTFQPSLLPCRLGDSYLWGVKYDTGGAIPAGALSGNATLQLSNGGAFDIRLSDGFSQQLGRRTGSSEGKPGKVRVVSNATLKPLKKIIHIQER